MIQHTEPDYYGRCTRCGERIESPSQAMRDKAEATGGKLVTMRAAFRVTLAQARLMFPDSPHPCATPSVHVLHPESLPLPAPSTPEEPT